MAKARRTNFKRLIWGMLAAACILAMSSPCLAAQVTITNRAMAAYADVNNVAYTA